MPIVKTYLRMSRSSSASRAGVAPRRYRESRIGNMLHNNIVQCFQICKTVVAQLLHAYHADLASTPLRKMPQGLQEPWIYRTHSLLNLLTSSSISAGRTLSEPPHTIRLTRTGQERCVSGIRQMNAFCHFLSVRYSRTSAKDKVAYRRTIDQRIAFQFLQARLSMLPG
jgi:hypothetical protein